MAVVINGTTGITSVNGSASAPSVTGTDTDTGIVYGTNTLSLATGGITAVTVDSSQNVGIGTGSPAYKLDVQGGNVSVYNSGAAANSTIAYRNGTKNWYAGLRGDTSNVWAVADDSAFRMAIDSSGNVGIGVVPVAGAGKLQLGATEIIGFQAASGGNIASNLYYASGWKYITTGTATLYSQSSGGHYWSCVGSGSANATATFSTQMALDPNGYLMVGKASSNVYANGFEIRPEGTCYATISSATGSSYHLLSSTSGTFKFYVTETGGVANYSGNNVNLSDERTKKNIEIVSGYLAKICAIPVKMFNYKDEEEGEQRTLGVIAQDVEAVAPEFVNSTDGWKGAEPEDGTPLKTIYTTDMMFGLMNAIQELKAIVDAQAVEIAALKGNA